MDLHVQLEMPLEALVLRHSAATAGSLWACLVVLSTAFGLWLLRSAVVASQPDDPRCHPDQSLFQSPSPQPEAREASPWPEAPSPPHVKAREEGTCVSLTRKGTLFEARGCYEEDEGDAVEGGHLEQEEQLKQQQQQPWAGDGGVVYGLGGGMSWGERWRGDLGWYLHQDVAALNGRVVRLWEDEKRLAASSLIGRRRQVAW